MRTIYYKKEGRRYIPVKEYDDDCMWAMPYGDHLVMKYKNGETRVHNIDPAFAPMIAAGRYAEDSLAKSIMDASAMRPRTTPLTVEQWTAWRALEKAFGDDIFQLTWPAAQTAANNAIEKMAVEANKLLEVPAVKNAYDHFMLVYKLTKETHE